MNRDEFYTKERAFFFHRAKWLLFNLRIVNVARAAIKVDGVALSRSKRRFKVGRKSVEG